MSRIVFWIALLALVFFALRSKLRAALRKQEMNMSAQQRPQWPHAAPAIEDMTSCAQCGLHFPASEALHADGRDYCSPAHLPANTRL